MVLLFFTIQKFNKRVLYLLPCKMDEIFFDSVSRFKPNYTFFNVPYLMVSKINLPIIGKIFKFCHILPNPDCNLQYIELNSKSGILEVYICFRIFQTRNFQIRYLIFIRLTYWKAISILFVINM